jgi:hypothetical protein
MDQNLINLLKTLCHKSDWRWDHPFPGDIGEDGRWEISLYRLDDLTEDGFAGYAALAELENGHWMIIFRPEEEEGELRLVKPTLLKAKYTLDLLLGANTPPLLSDRDAADPWFGDEDLHREILSQMLYSPEDARRIRAEVDATLRKLPPGSSPFQDRK